MPDEKRVPRVSVCMSMRNAEAYVGECVASILGQSFSDFELLIADDGSTDGSVAVVRGFDDDRIRLIERDHDFVGSLNCVMSQARGRYIARMDADDVMLPERLSRQYEYMEAHGDVAAVSGEAIRIDEAGNRIGRIGGGGAEQEITARMMCEGNCVCNPSTMVRRDFIMKHGLVYEREFVYAEDYRFWSRVVAEGGRIVSLPGAVIKYRHCAGQVTATRTVEMDAASERIRRELTSALIDGQNKGYRDPEIADRGNELTLIIPFLNEGDEVENTVRSFMSHSGSSVYVIVINDGSYDSYPYMDRLGEIEGVSYVLNRERLGVAGSRDKGVELCKTPYFLLLDAHMRAYDDKWVTEIPRLLRENDRRILCCQTKFLHKRADGCVEEDPKSPPAYGARMTFRMDRLMPGIEWIKEELRPELTEDEIPCVLGAGYGVSRRYWRVLGGLQGLLQYGCDEQLLSLKTWLEGGKCVLVKQCEFGHIYRDTTPYDVMNSAAVYNSLVISETLFPLRERCKARAAAYTADRIGFAAAFQKVAKSINELRAMTAKKCLNSPDGRSFDEVVRMNLAVTGLERDLFQDIRKKLPTVAEYAIDMPMTGAGLYEGCTGRALWLFEYSRYANNIKMANKAKEILNNGLRMLNTEDIRFGSGMTGIGWALRYMANKGFHVPMISHIRSIDDVVMNYLYITDKCDSGILAYCCSLPEFTCDNDICKQIDRTAARVLAEREVSATDAYYSLLWMQLRHNGLKVNHIALSLNDWIKPSHFIAVDKKYWKPSLYDGVVNKINLSIRD